MADICCGAVGKAAEAASPPATTEVVSCKTSSRAARRRRMQLRQVRYTSQEELMEAPPSDESDAKRRRLEPDTLKAASLSPDALKADPGEEVVVEIGLGDNENRMSEQKDSLAEEIHQGKVKTSDDSDESPPKYGMTSVCGRRSEMEDAVAIRPDFVRQGDGIAWRCHFFGVYDGHGCSHVATACGDQMHEMVAEEMSTLKAGLPPSPNWWTSAIKRSFLRMDAAVVGYCSEGPQPTANCRCELQTPRCDHVGSTAVVAVVKPSHIIVGNCGDSRAVLCRKGVAIPLSTDHKPDRPDELQRIEAAGGRVIYWDGARVLGVLAMSRAIGDSYLKPYVIPEPEVTVTERSEEDECLILASDGLWDVVTNEMACNVARTCLRSVAPAPERSEDREAESTGGDGGDDGGSPDMACSEAAVVLTQLALARQSADNISVVVVDLRRRR